VTALLAAERHHLAEIDLALARVADGAYGVCASCGRPIGAERLDALPTTTICIDCASAGG
jgi:RNA polymerase-binding protein DksA